MNQEESNKLEQQTRVTFQNQFLNHDNRENKEISNIYTYIDQKINLTIQNNSQMIRELQSRLNQFE